MAPPEVSVVMPVGAVDAAVPEAIESVLAQVAAFEFEVMLSVNTSDPHDLHSLASIVADLRDDRVRRIDSSSRPGAAPARNAGAEATTSSVLVFCDADDIVEAGWLEALVGGLDEFDAVTGHVTSARFVDGDHADRHPDATPGRLPTFMDHEYLLSGNMAITRAAFDAVGGFDTTLTRCEDIAIGWALQRDGYRIGYVPEAVLHYRPRQGRRDQIRQYYRWGQGMAEVLATQERPGNDEGTGLTTMLRPNSSVLADLDPDAIVRKLSIGAGRLVGLIRTRRKTGA